MENWGLITYRETALLYDEAVDPAVSKQRVATVIAHELAHQWFGNLVTMEWWDGLWLNEGFATFTEYIGTDSTEPSFDMHEQFLLDTMFTALSADGLNESHPIIQNVSNPDEINELFDAISYSKGGTVIRMIRDILTAEKFQEGITYYLKKSQFGNAETQQLWDALQTVVKDPTMDVSEIMNTWTLQMGYPVLQVNTGSGQVTQERFFDLKPNGSIAPSPYDYVWLVPFNYLTEKDSSSEFVNNTFRIIRDKEETVAFPSDLGFIKVNVNQSGFYRVNYDLRNWYNIIAHLQSNPDSEVLTPSDRAGLLEDAFGLSSAGLLDTRVALNLSQYISRERNYVPCYAGLAKLRSIGARLSLTPVYGLYQEFILNLTSDLAQEFNLSSAKNLSHLEIFLRSTVLGVAWRHGNTDVIDAANGLFRDWMEGNVTVSADVKSVVYAVGVACGGEEEWDFVWERYLSTTDPYEKRLYLSALGESQSPWILSRYLEYAINTSKVRSQDATSVIGYVSGNVHGRYLAWNFFRSNWDYILKQYGEGSFGFSRLIKAVTAHFTTELELNEVERFFQEQANLGSGARAVRQSIEIIKRNIQWLKTNQGLIQDCLTDTESCFSSS
jgi:aminopeptidase N